MRIKRDESMALEIKNKNKRKRIKRVKSIAMELKHSDKRMINKN